MSATQHLVATVDGAGVSIGAGIAGGVDATTRCRVAGIHRADVGVVAVDSSTRNAVTVQTLITDRACVGVIASTRPRDMRAAIDTVAGIDRAWVCIVAK